MAARIPPTETAPPIAVLDQPRSRRIGSTKIESTATAAPWRANPAAQTHASTTQP
jgi:hypothetical protein